MQLAEAKWILRCPQGCFEQTAFKRSYLNRGRMCACGAACVYRKREVHSSPAEELNSPHAAAASTAVSSKETEQSFDEAVRHCSQFLQADEISW